MKAFETTFENVIYRFGLMMLIVILSFTLGVPAAALLAVPVFLTAMLGLKFRGEAKAKVAAVTKELPIAKSAA